ncbi:impact protein [Seiridium cupressi]
MASQQDLQELLRLLTVGKVPIKDAMMRVKALQARNLRSYVANSRSSRLPPTYTLIAVAYEDIHRIKQIAEAPLADIESAISDPKAAKSLQNACKARLKNPNPSSTSKRAGAELLQSTQKRTKASSDTGFLDGPIPIPPAEYEASLSLPCETSEDVIAKTTLITNRAPLVLAFAVELLRYTMPEQPPSSRLSLAQAVVSANSRSKAVSIGIEKGPSADDDGWGHGQPRIRVMGREIAVLKRGGYEWKREEETNGKIKEEDAEGGHSVKKEDEGTNQIQNVAEENSTVERISKTWSASSPVLLKQSTFIVRATQITQASERQSTLQGLFSAVPNLQTASHNAWAYRVKKPDMFGSFTIKEDSNDDGESGCGGFMLKTMRESDAINTLVVMTRWYGGIMLGPDRWRIMRNCLKEALAERLRVKGERASLGGEAVWGLDLEAMKQKSTSTASSAIGMPVHRPEAARGYLLRSFADRKQDGEEPTTTPKKKTGKALEIEKEENLGRLLGALRLVYDSWADHLSAMELDRRAWAWYTAVRPEVEGGPSGWGAKGDLKLKKILDLRRKEA